MGMWLFGSEEVSAALKSVMLEANIAARAIVTQGLALVEANAKNNFSGSHARGEPHEGGSQPNVVSGDLRRSIIQRPARPIGVAAWAGQVGPTMVYGRRVELGFTGTDSRGRHYNQPAYPYFQPAVEASKPKLEAIAIATWARFVHP